MSLHLYSLLQVGRQEWEGQSFALVFSKVWGEPLSQQGANPSSLLCVWCVRCLLSPHPLMFPSEDEEQRWSSSGSTLPYHKSPPRVIRERTHPLPTFLNIENSSLAHFHSSFFLWVSIWVGQWEKEEVWRIWFYLIAKMHTKSVPNRNRSIRKTREKKNKEGLGWISFHSYY